MRVLYLNPFSQQVSGPDESLLTLLEKLIPMGIEAHVVLPRPGPHVPRYEQLGAKVHFAPLSTLKRQLGASDIALFLPRLIRGVLAVARLARRERIDRIHTNMEVVLDGAIVSRLLRLPHVLHYRGNTLDRPRLVFAVLTRFWTSTAERIFCISNATAAVFRKRRLGAKVEVVYNPVHVDAFAAATRSNEVRQELGAGPRDLLVGTVGRIHPRKDLLTFLRAGAIVAKHVANLRLAVIGTAEAPEELAYYDELKALARALALECRLSWAGARRDMPNVLKAVDIGVLCSRHEGFGRVLAEAMAAGTPMVVSREGALPELVEDGQDALCATPGQPEDFARTIQLLCSDSNLRRSISARAVTRAQAFSVFDIATRVAAAYRSVTPAVRS